MTPPSLVWVESFTTSTGAALGQKLIARVYPTVNPLIYRIRLDFYEPVKLDAASQIWNLFQKWAAANECTPSGRVEMRNLPSPVTGELYNFGFQVEVHLKERLGPPRDVHPT